LFLQKNIVDQLRDRKAIPELPASAPKKFNKIPASAHKKINKSFQIPKYNPTLKSAKFF